jgi:hypothetical protein
VAEASGHCPDGDEPGQHLASASRGADQGDDRQAKREQENAVANRPTRSASFTSGSLTLFTAERGTDTAKLTGPAWCDKAQISEKWDPGRIRARWASGMASAAFIDGALHICQRPNDATWRTEAATSCSSG